MGLAMTIMWNFFAWMLGLCIVGTAILYIINKLFMFHGPEDEEVWEESKEHFKIWEWLDK